MHGRIILTEQYVAAMASVFSKNIIKTMSAEKALLGDKGGTMSETNSIRIEIAKLVITAAATIIVPVMIAYFTVAYQSSQNDQLKLRYVELSIEILKETPESQSPELRRWALETLNQFSAIALSNKAKEQLLLSPIAEPKEVADEKSPNK